MIPNLSYVLKLYKNPVDAKSTLIRSTSIACLEMFFSFPIIRPPSGISPSVYNLLWFLPKDPANTLKATVSVCCSILLTNSVWSLDESKLCQLTKPQFEYDEIVPPILKSACWQGLELFLILPARSTEDPEFSNSFLQDLKFEISYGLEIVPERSWNFPNIAGQI